MTKRNVATDILNIEMDRKEFVLYLFATFMAISGITGLWKNIQKAVFPFKKEGFSTGPYGGSAK